MPRSSSQLPTYPPKYMIKFSPRELADAAWAHLSEGGEPHPAAPRTRELDAAIRAFDGNDASIARIRAAYLAAFRGHKPSDAFLRYTYAGSPRNARESSRLANAAIAYVSYNGAPHPYAPWTALIEEALAEYDGNDDSIEALHGAYTTAFREEPPHPKFLAYAFP